MNKGEINNLLDKYLHGSATPGEKQTLFDWYQSFQKDKDTWNEGEVGNYEETRKKILNQVIYEIDNQEQEVNPKKRNWRYLAASVIIMISAGLYLIQPVQKIEEPLSSIILPGGNKATLTLANGRRIILTESKDGEIAEQAGITIIKTRDGMLKYVCNNSRYSDPTAPGTVKDTYFNTIETPK